MIKEEKAQKKEKSKTYDKRGKGPQKKLSNDGELSDPTMSTFHDWLP